MYIQVLALYAAGLTTGLAVDCGNSLTITPVVDGYSLPHAGLQASLGGLQVDNAFSAELVRRYGAAFAGDTFQPDICRLKEAHGYISASPAAEADPAVALHRMHTGAKLAFDRDRTKEMINPV